MKRFLFALALACLLVLLLPLPALAVPSYDQAVDKLFEKGYPQRIEEYLTSLGTSPLGYRAAGTTSEHQGALYIAETLRAIGLRHVRLEPVPIDAWEPRGASVTIGDREMVAAQLVDCPGTPPEGITGELVYVPDFGSAAAFDASPDVTDKIVMIDNPLDSWWWQLPFAEAYFRGAKAVIVAGYKDAAGYGAGEDTLFCFQASFDSKFIPVVWVTWRDGQWIQEQLAAGEPVGATVKNDFKITRAADGGTGYNVIGVYPGKKRNGEKVLVSAHHDAWFQGALDDTGACANAITMAKAMRISGYKPQRDVVFLFTTGEEYGLADSWYGWLVGAWWAASHTHKDWAGKVVGQLNIELMAMKDAPLSMGAVPEWKAWLEDMATQNPELLPNSYALRAKPISTWNDQWPFTAEGISSVVFAADTAPYHPNYYHTPYDSVDLMDWEYLAQINKFIFRCEQQLDRGLLPHRLGGLADSLAATVSVSQLVADGADPDVAARLGDAVADFQSASGAYDATRDSIPASRFGAVNEAVVGIAKELNSNLTQSSAWDATVYPHEQVMWDLEYLNAALAALDQTEPDSATALEALVGVGMTWYGINFSHETYTWELSRHMPDHPVLCWAEGRLAPFLDVMPQYYQIEAEQYAAATDGLTAMRAAQVTELNMRLADMADVLEGVTPQIETLL